MAKATPQQLLWEARKIAQAHNMYVVDCVDKGQPVHVLYRNIPGRTKGERLGKSRSPVSFRRLVRRCAGVAK